MNNRWRASRLSFNVFSLVLTVAILGCGLPSGTPAGAIVGRSGRYDYSPSVIQSANVQQFWWCGEGSNPNKSSQTSDVILYESLDLSTKVTQGPMIVLGETPGAWDSIYTCNPKVIRGSFVNPLGDPHVFGYAMYYVATDSPAGLDNRIGVAFSDDGIVWKKYPLPIISPSFTGSYGVGQPAVYNSDGKQAIWVFYEEDTPFIHHVKATSVDGIHFTAQGSLTTNGLDDTNPTPSWGDMAYDYKTNYWYAAYNLPDRNSSTTGGIIERGQYGFQLYRIPDASLITGDTPWQQLMTVDTILTGNESNFIPGFLRDNFGNVNIAAYPSIQMYTSMSNPRPALDSSPKSAGSSGDTSNWDIGSAVWVPDQQSLPFTQYSNSTIHEATTGWIDPGANFKVESSLGHLYQSPQDGATVPFYGCKRGSTDYFVSLDQGCESQRYLGVNGYGYSAPMANHMLVPLYSCVIKDGHLLSRDPMCEGNTTEGLLGYVLP